MQKWADVIGEASETNKNSMALGEAGALEVWPLPQ